MNPAKMLNPRLTLLLLVGAIFTISGVAAAIAQDAPTGTTEDGSTEPPAPSEAKSSDTTPLGAIRAGNEDGTIPEWTGGITAPPDGYEKGDHHPDPFRADTPRFRVTAKNLGEHRDKLSAGQVAMLERYPDTWYLEVYPTRRSASYPQSIYDAATKNRDAASLTPDGNGVLNCTLTSPFPEPKSGIQAIWNHLLRYRGKSVIRNVVQVAPTASGSFVPVRIEERVLWAYAQPGATIASIDNRLAYFLQIVEAPARLAGNLLLVHETLNQAEEERRAWVYNPGQRRVRRAPNVAYDNPGTASDAQRTNDQLDMFNGAPDRYDWKLVGRKEMIVPYNCYKLHSDSIDHDDLLKAGHIDPSLVRYEVHRVWVVEATVKEGTSHIYARRTFHLDEDSWQALVVDQYDSRGDVWRVSEAYCINYYEVPMFWDTLQCHYDLQNGRYLAFGLNNETRVDQIDVDLEVSEFKTNALRRLGRR